jgi:hypothetical protein
LPALARWLLGLGIVATLAANVAHGLGHGIIGAVVAAWPALALVGSYELLMVILRSAHIRSVAPSTRGDAPMNDPLFERAELVFAADLAVDRVHRYALFAEHCTSVNRVPSGCATTSLSSLRRAASTSRRNRRRSAYRAPCA